MRTNQVVFEVGGVVLSSRLIDGQFPNYRQLLPDAYEHELQLAGGEITDVVRRIRLLAQKNAPLRLAFSEGELTVSAQTPDVGEARETLPVPFPGEPLEIGFNPEFLRDGLESGRVRRRAAEADPPAAAGPDRGGRRQRLPVPDHADPAERADGRRRVIVTRLTPARLPHLRGGGGAARARADRRHRPQRRRQDEPARGALLRLHRALVPDGERARVRALRRAAHAARARAARTRGGAHELSVGFQPGRAEAAARRRRAGRAADRRRGAPAGVRLPARPARARHGRAGAAPRAPRPGRRRAVAGARGDAPRLRAGARPAQRAASPRSAPAAPAAARCRPGTPSSPATAIALMADRAAAVERAAPALRRARRRARASPATPSCATARARRPRRAEELAAELAERLDVRPRARLHRPRAAPRRPRAARATAASCAPTARGASSGSALLALLLAEREALAERAARRR